MLKKLENQLRNIFRGHDNIEFVNNGDWLGKLSMIEFLRDYGKLINVNYLLAKDSVSSRLENGLSLLSLVMLYYKESTMLI